MEVRVFSVPRYYTNFTLCEDGNVYGHDEKKDWRLDCTFHYIFSVLVKIFGYTKFVTTCSQFYGLYNFNK